ncbi:tyrosine-protein phosphatase [Paenibacillus sp. GCM10012307]|uniref:Tyrosine-protein phosphatase n=1 Tax=Paenibacillus roseus TaxID=2798579 RepID=A0A934J5C5_9BACL|nr:CpsB/CapC family capsule biosynthesis tyrosine phosphatase [Paenibacillus roseus]MBJ6361984.1 protein tyrosine phosphatase [Paenibacillus roseus]
MIDIHSHILPGADDGAKDWDDTLQLARAAVEDGIHTIVATPHHASRLYWNYAAEVRELTSEVNRRLVSEGIALQVLPGQEIRVHDDLLEAWSRGELLPLGNSDYVLIEMPSSAVPKNMAELIHELSILGLRTIIAHPERNKEIVNDPQLLEALLEAGAYGQMTTHSLLGGFGRQIERNAWQLCKKGLVHVIASDAHHIEKRNFRLREAYDRVEKELGKSWRVYYERNAEHIVNGRSLEDLPSELDKKNLKIWRGISRFFRY